MNNVFKEKFYTWLMWLLPIACTGFQGVVFWTVWIFCSYRSKVEQNKMLNIPLQDREEIKEMNRNENLNKHDKEILSKCPGHIKVAEGVYQHIPKKM